MDSTMFINVALLKTRNNFEFNCNTISLFVTFSPLAAYLVWFEEADKPTDRAPVGTLRSDRKD